MVLGPVIIQAAKTGIRLAGRYFALESKAFNKLYMGFPQSKVIGRGIRHGLLAGQVAGSFINSLEFNNGGNAPVPFKKVRFRAKTRKSYKTRRRQPTRCRARRRRF